MKMILLEYLFCVCIFLQCYDGVFSTETASLYGGSYIHVPLQDAKSTTEVQLKFRTKQSDALLLLAAGRTDYCLIRLESGRLKVHINLGAGESEVASPKGLRLNDLTWHQVVVSRTDANVTLLVDQIHVTRQKLPGKFFELNIHYGLYVGGQGDFSELFLGHGEWLRGCLADVVYNGVNVLHRARHRSGKAEAQCITWNCAAEFDASLEQDISFVEEGAFITLPNIINRTGVKWEVEIKTQLDQGVLLYSSGLTPGRSDFVGVEVVGGHVRATLDKGSGAVELTNDILVNDANWHSITVRFSPMVIEITVDGRSNSLKLAHTGSRYFDLSETVYIGGVELNKRARALGQGLKAADTSFKGCMRLMAADGKRFGLPSAKITQGILPECVWSYPCLQNPCAVDAKCVQQGVDSFRCECLRSHCLKEDFATTYKVFSKTSQLELVELSPLTVTEGENALLTPSHVNVVLDYAKYGVRDSGVLFLTVGSPSHGRLAVEVWERGGQRPDQQVFTLLDLAKDKVRYLHDGSESSEDSIMMDLELAPGPGFIIPGYLQGRHRFVVHVDITPVNDPPSLHIPSSRILRLAQGTRKKLTKELLNATDADTVADSLHYWVLGNNSGGVVERIDDPGSPVTSFTQADVDMGRVVFHHTGGVKEKTKLTLQVSDGVETSPAAFLHISVVPLHLTLENNTGAILTHNSWALITPANLSFSTNSDDPSLLIHYQVVSEPHCGSVQKQIASQWYKAESFTSKDLTLGEVRYLACSGTPQQDNFTLQVSAGGVVATSKLTFRLTFTELHLVSVNNALVTLENVRDAVISEEHLMYSTTPLAIEPSSLSFEVVGLPQYGSLSVNGSVLRQGEVFTQQDIFQHRVHYKLHRTVYSELRDSVTFRVSAPQCQALAPASLRLLHTPPPQLRQRVSVVLNTLKVTEGASAVLSQAHLDVSMAGLSYVEYELTRPPAHGTVDVLMSDGSLARANASLFTTGELAQHRVRYTHDGSETTSDKVEFAAVSTREEDFLYVGELDISVELTNDNAPTRAIEKVFRVVQGGERLLTGQDLKYDDADVNCVPRDIMYTRKDVANGGLFSAQDPQTPLFQFTQDDLNEGRVLFRHEGEAEGRLSLLVSDGVHHTDGVLEINASPPYVQVVNNTRLVVRQGGSALISTHNLYADTNVNLKHSQIRFEVTEGPSQGVLELENSLDLVKMFVQGDIVNNRFSYRHNGDVTSVQDVFSFKVSVEGAQTSAQFQIRVFPAGYWDPLTVTNNQTLHVEESTSVTITSAFLQVKQPHVPASDITYLVVQPPRYGYLELEAGGGGEERDEEVLTFTQELVNSGRLHYVQATANQTRDTMVVQVTNGISWLTGLLVTFLVVPERLYIGGGELRCEEGGNITLPPSLLPPLTEYYTGRLTEYRLHRPLQHGRLVSTSQPGRSLTKWSPHQMQSGVIQYVHDGSETTEEVFMVIARAGDKESLPARVKVTISLVNDEVPTIINNTLLKLWRGGSQVITSSHLAAEDKDTPPENVTYAILSATAGHVAFVSEPSVAIDRFTQAQINHQQLIFLHSGESVDGEVDTIISDGVNSVGPIIFKTQCEEVTLHVVNNRALNVFPLLRRTITPDHLTAECSDPSRQVVYKVRNPPSLGQLVIEPHSAPVLNFTQADISALRLSYQHTTPQSNHATNDSFTFDVVAPFSLPLSSQEFHIDISVWSGGLDEFLDTSYSLRVDEGGHAGIFVNTSRLMSVLAKHVGAPTITGKLWETPVHGMICVRGNCSDNQTKFSDWELNNGYAEYHHDHSDTLQDTVSLSLYLEPGDVLLCNISIPIHINPINDQPFTLVTPAPQVKCVQGQRRTITRHDLLTEDADTPARDIIYEIINGPTFGALAVNGNSSSGRFTQADIDFGRVIFEHSGPLQPASFYFRVWDGQFNPAYTVFNIDIIPVALNITVVSSVLLQQGSSVAVITGSVFLIDTNGKEDSVIYNVSKNPLHGVIYVGDVETNTFRQADLNARRVMYMQTDMTTHSDTFELSAIFPLEDSPNVTGLSVNISVEPLVKFGKFYPLAGTKTKLTTEHLDASPLRKLTSSDPVFKVLKKPRYGKLKKIIRSSGEKRTVKEKEITKFTHEEIRSGVIYYVARRIHDTQPDMFPFLLSASIFQPAIGEMRFEVIGENGHPPTTFTPPKPPRLPGPKPPIGHEGVEIASPNMSDDYLLVVSMVAGTVVLAIIVVMLVRCGSKRAESIHHAKGDLNAPLPLPQPPDELLPMSPQPKRSDSMTPGSLPQCKVIPLGPTGLGDSVTESEPELNLRYPYGAADEDWSSYEASETNFSQRANNPMLRRNQYWV